MSERGFPGRVPPRSSQLLQALRHGQLLHIAFVHDVDNDSGTLISREPQIRRVCKHSLNFSQCYKYKSALRRQNRKRETRI